MILAVTGELTEKWVIDYLEHHRFGDVAFGLLIFYLASLGIAAFIGWLASGVTRVASLQRTLAATEKIKGEVTSQKEAILTSIRTSRDELSAADSQVTEALIELRNRIEKGHTRKADESRDLVCELLTGKYWRALEDHCERIEYVLTGFLRHREIDKTLTPAVDSVCNKLDTINNEEVMRNIGARTKLLLRPSTIYPIIATIKTITPWWKPWTWKRFKEIESRFKPHLRNI